MRKNLKTHEGSCSTARQRATRNVGSKGNRAHFAPAGNAHCPALNLRLTARASAKPGAGRSPRLSGYAQPKAPPYEGTTLAELSPARPPPFTRPRLTTTVSGSAGGLAAFNERWRSCAPTRSLHCGRVRASPRALSRTLPSTGIAPRRETSPPLTGGGSLSACPSGWAPHVD